MSNTPFFRALFCFAFSIAALFSFGQAAPANDDCSGAVQLTVSSGNTCANLYSTSVGYATQSLPSCIATGYQARDAWFKFTATTATHRVTVNPVSYSNYVFEVFSGSCGSLASIACINTGSSNEPDVALLTGLTVGSTYYIRVYDYYANASTGTTFSLCVNSATTLIDNDDCAGATPVTPSPNENAGTATLGNGYGATQSFAGCNGSAEDDIWFTFTATSSRHRIGVNTERSIYPVLEVFSGSCTSLSLLQCRYGNSASFVDADLTNLVPGSTYYYRVYGQASNNVRTSISTTVSTPPVPPANDECSGALSLTVNTASSCASVYRGSTGFSTQSSPSCVASGYDAKDVWFKFTAVASAQKITVTPISYNDYVFQVYSGNCGSLSSIACVNTGTSNEPDVALLNNLTVGNTYYLRVYDYYGGGSNTRQFSVCVSTTTAPVENDDCGGALTVTPSTDSVSGASVTANNTGATQSLAGCYGTAEDDVWFKFTATASRHKIWVNTNEDINPVLQVFSGACGSLTSMTCRYYAGPGPNSYVDADLTNLVPGATYYYRIYGSAAGNLRTSISTYITSPPLPPAHDDCSGAIPLTVAADNGCSGLFNGSMSYATQSRPSCAASYYDAKDVWFKFTAVAGTQRITVTPVSYDDYAFEVFSGTCGSLTSIACINNGSLNDPDVALLTGLVAGNTYYVRLYDYYGNGSSFRKFSICVNSATQYVNNDDCSGATPVTPSADANPGPVVDAYNVGAAPSSAGCYGTAEDDVWFRFTATSSRHRIVVLTEEVINPVLQVFSGSCTNLNSIGCYYTDVSSPSDFADADLTNLTIGATYYYRVYGAASNNIGSRISTNIRTFQIVLPVSLINFRLTQSGGQNLLSWQTGTEANNKGFAVQYSRNGNDFDSLAFVLSKAPNGNSSQPVFYEYLHDPSLLPEGKIYYRLKQVNLDGLPKYSGVISTSTGPRSVSVFPNPVKEYISIKTASSRELAYRLLDACGRLLKEGKTSSQKIDLREFKPGVYVLEGRSTDVFFVSKIVKE